MTTNVGACFIALFNLSMLVLAVELLPNPVGGDFRTFFDGSELIFPGLALLDASDDTILLEFLLADAILNNECKLLAADDLVVLLGV